MDCFIVDVVDKMTGSSRGLSTDSLSVFLSLSFSFHFPNI